MEKKRGRPKTGQKKGISFRIEEELFEKYEKIAQEKAGVSIYTYTKDNLGLLFGVPPEETSKIKKLVKENEELKRKLNSIKKIILYNF